MTVQLNQTLIDFLNNSTTTCIPQGYDKVYPYDSIPNIQPNNYFKLLSGIAFADLGFENFNELVQIILNRPYSPQYANVLLLSTLQNVLGLQFITQELDEEKLRNVLYAKLLANINDGTIRNTFAIYQTLMQPLFIRRIRLGQSCNINYTSVAGTLPITFTELRTFWAEAVTGGIYVELANARLDYFGFLGDPFANGFGTITDELILKTFKPYFGFAGDTRPNATGFGSVTQPTIGGHWAILVPGELYGGHFSSILTAQAGVSS